MHTRSATPLFDAAAILPPAIAALSIPERLVVVIREKNLEGQPTTIQDFLEAAETCDLSEAVIAANIGAAKRMLRPEIVRQVYPSVPMMPWDMDPSYRRERIAKAAEILVDLPLTACDPNAFADLRHGFSAGELKALWPEIIGEALGLLSARKFAGAAS